MCTEIKLNAGQDNKKTESVPVKKHSHILRTLRLRKNWISGLYWSSSQDYDPLVIHTTNQFIEEITELRGNCCVHRSYMVRSSEAFPGPSVKYSSCKKSPADASEASCMNIGLKDQWTLNSSHTKRISIFLGLKMSIVLLKQRTATKMKDLLKSFAGL